MSSPHDVGPVGPGRDARESDPAADGSPEPSIQETFANEESRRAVAEARAAAAGSPRRRGPRSMRSMIWSLAPLVALVVVMVVLFQPREQHPPATIDPGPAYSYAGQELSDRLPQPVGLPAGWRATSADVATAAPDSQLPASLRVGYLTPKQKYIGLVESPLSETDVVDQQIQGAQKGSTEQIDGRVWQRYTAPNGEPALLATYGKVTVLITGNAGDDEMTTLIKALS